MQRPPAIRCKGDHGGHGQVAAGAQSRTMDRLPCASTWYPFSVPTRYAGAIQTWRSTPILQYSSTPTLHQSARPDSRTRTTTTIRGRRRYEDEAPGEGVDDFSARIRQEQQDPESISIVIRDVPIAPERFSPSTTARYRPSASLARQK